MGSRAEVGLDGREEARLRRELVREVHLEVRVCDLSRGVAARHS